MNPDAPFPQRDAEPAPRLRWYRCHGCGWEAWVKDGVRNSAGCGNPECHHPCLHVHSNADGEQPNTLAPYA